MINDRNNDQWLDDLLAQPMHVNDNGFSQKVVAEIENRNSNRRWILGISWFVAALLAVATFPFKIMQEWMSIENIRTILGGTVTSANIENNVAAIDLATTNAALLQSPYAFVFLVLFGAALVYFYNLVVNN